MPKVFVFVSITFIWKDIISRRVLGVDGFVSLRIIIRPVLGLLGVWLKTKAFLVMLILIP